MRKSRWEKTESLPGQYTQLRLFPPTPEEILMSRINQFETDMKEKLERQRKGQFGKIGRQEKRLTDLEERFIWMEKAICHQVKQEVTDNSSCEILEMVLP